MCDKESKLHFNKQKSSIQKWNVLNEESNLIWINMYSLAQEKHFFQLTHLIYVYQPNAHKNMEISCWIQYICDRVIHLNEYI